MVGRLNHFGAYHTTAAGQYAEETNCIVKNLCCVWLNFLTMGLGLYPLCEKSLATTLYGELLLVRVCFLSLAQFFFYGVFRAAFVSCHWLAKCLQAVVL